MPKGTCVFQRDERIRWANMPEPSPSDLAGKLLLVGEQNAAALPEWTDGFARIEKVGELARMRGPLVIEGVELDTLESPKGDVLDRSPPPELTAR
jgi:hypothetical protein